MRIFLLNHKLSDSNFNTGKFVNFAACKIESQRSILSKEIGYLNKIETS